MQTFIVRIWDEDDWTEEEVEQAIEEWGDTPELEQVEVEER